MTVSEVTNPHLAITCITSILGENDEREAGGGGEFPSERHRLHYAKVHPLLDSAWSFARQCRELYWECLINEACSREQATTASWEKALGCRVNHTTDWSGPPRSMDGGALLTTYKDYGRVKEVNVYLECTGNVLAHSWLMRKQLIELLRTLLFCITALCIG